jgi:hypothetical protein
MAHLTPAARQQPVLISIVKRTSAGRVDPADSRSSF